MTDREIEAQLKKLDEKKTRLYRQGKFVQAMKVDGEILELRKRVVMTAEYERANLADCIRNESQEVQDEFEYQVCLFSVLADMLYTVTMEISENLKRHTEFSKLSVTENVKDINKRISAVVRILDLSCNADTAEDYGSFSDDLLPLLKQKAQEHIAWIQMERDKNIAYAKD